MISGLHALIKNKRRLHLLVESVQQANRLFPVREFTGNKRARRGSCVKYKMLFFNINNNIGNATKWYNNAVKALNHPFLPLPLRLAWIQQSRVFSSLLHEQYDGKHHQYRPR